MNCQEIRKNDLHEQYLLASISDSDKEAYEKHLQSCKACQEEQQAQRQLISGIREIGRQEMKAEIRQQAAALGGKPRRADWGMLVRVAAVLFVVVLSPTVYYIYKTRVPASPPALEGAADVSSALSRMPQDSVGDKKERFQEFVQTEPVREEARRVGGQMSLPDKQARGLELSNASRKNVDKIERARAPEPAATKETAQTEQAPAESEQQIAQGLKSTSFFRDDAEKDQRKSAGEDAAVGLLQKKAKTDVDAAAATVLALDEVTEQKSGSAPAIRFWSFQIDSLTLVVELVITHQDSSTAAELPQRFDVEMTQRAGHIWKMKWSVNRDFAALDSSKISIKRLQTDLLEVTLSNNVAYRMTLQNKTGVATRIK